MKHPASPAQELKAPFHHSVNREGLALVSRQQRDYSISQLFFGQTDEAVIATVREAVVAEQERKRLEVWQPNVISWKRFLSLKICNRKQY